MWPMISPQRNAADKNGFSLRSAAARFWRACQGSAQTGGEGKWISPKIGKSHAVLRTGSTHQPLCVMSTGESYPGTGERQVLTP